MSRPPCKFHNTPQGCRKGPSCHFSHRNPEGSPSPSLSTGSNVGRSARPQPPASDAPPGTCRFFWTSGRCNREFACRYRHTLRQQDSTSSLSTPSINHSPQNLDTIAPFLTEAGLAKLTSTGSDIFFSNLTKAMSPNEAHNSLKRFLYDDFRFRKTFDAYAFLTPLNSANSSNSTWTAEDGQLLLTSIATGNGLLRINDIIRWTPVSTQAGSSPFTLSFQRGYLPLLRLYSSDIVVKSTLSHLVNGLYMGIMDNFDHFCDQLENCMEAIMVAYSFKDPSMSTNNDPLGSQVIVSLASIFFECLTRFKNVTATHPRILPIVRRLQLWTDTWIAGVSSSPPLFDDPFKGTRETTRSHILDYLKGKIERLIHIANREQAKIDRAEKKAEERLLSTSRSQTNDGILSALRITYDGPGELRAEGKRHDNDFVDIQDIRVAPTHQELISHTAPFLPANLYDAPHPLPAASMERLLDIQFRLLREELTAPLRTSIQLVRGDLLSSRRKTLLSEILQKQGGKYRGYADAQESIMFNVYTNVKFASLLPDRRGLSVSLSFDAPPGRARAPRAKARKQFWEGMSGKRMMQGGLIALVWKLGNEVAVHLGILAGSLRDLTESVSNSQDRVATRVVFFDPSIELRILHTLKNTPSHQAGTIILVEAPVMFEAIRPFLEALRVEPESIPFGKYLVLRPSDFFPFCGVEPPQYAKLPGFAYQLAPLFPPEAGVTDLKLFASNPTSIANARRELQRSRLDATQADAVVDALTREVALIQGPPGTGKSFTGVELLRVLIGCAKPILMIAFTNHALDHLMTSVLDAGITDKVVRLGSRSSDERMSQYSLEALELVVGKSRLDRSFGHHHRELKLVEEELKQLMKNFTRTEVTADEVMSYLQVQYPEHYEYLYQPPPWILAVKSLDDNTGWERAGKRGRHVIDDNSTYAFWMSGGDLRFLSTPNEPQMEIPLIPEVQTGSTNRFSALQELEAGVTSLSISDETPEDDENDVQEPWEQFWEESRPPREFNLPPPPPSQPVQASPSLVDPSQIQIADLRNPDAFFAAHGIDQIPSIPTLDRPLDGLLANGEIWTLSMTEREKLNSYWTQHVRESLHQNHLDDFASLRQKYADKLQVYNEGKNETRRQLLRDVDIVGCTTTGAAKLTSLLKGLGPRIMLVEEAGQVLEAHILGSLVPSIEHLILIGDPLQLRPTLNNYSLSVDSKTGSQLYKFDRSLMERLSSADFPMSQIDVQRRMRPTISNLIRRTLYPNLIDHELVKKYLDVRGFAKNVFFLTHTHKENGGTEESSSKFNTYEVDMIRDLVLYLLRQGCYSQEGDIVVLCAYLGQLARVRDALADAVAVVIDERDQEALADQEDEKSVDEDSHVEHVKVSKRVRLRTVDNYQGEEAKIIILSLVRNAGNIEDNPGARPTIGFLKSDNRTNVSLSRAKEGLFILGNSAQLASRSYMWRNVIAELEQEGHIGDAFPVACHRHPDSIMYISEPGKLPQFAPDGGCLRSCDARLKCGHVCPYKCHPDDPSHISVICVQPCTKLCPRRHPCHKECSEACGKCEFALSDVRLPCDHVNSSVPCHLIDQLEEVFCNVLITKQLPRCEHTAIMRCSDDASLYLCTSQCNGVAECCSRDCVANCHQCQSLNPTLDEAGCIPRTKHIEHPCRKILYCAHECTKSCSRDHECITSCKEPCRQECIHARCKQYCSTPCSPCQEPCTWRCAHYTCPLPCGSVCARLPCDKRCEYFLECGHGCPSVCGEDCSIQICPRCAPPEVKDKTVDFIMYRNLGDIAENEGTLDELLITLPSCGHVFTVETLDGICSINEYYTQSKDGAWLDLKSPDVSGSELKKPPVCPTCRAAITSPRYGRIFKSADLDILERNIISRMTSQLSAVQAMMESVSKANIEAKLLANVQNIKVDPIQVPAALQKSCVKAQRTLLAEARNSPIPLEAIMPENKHLFAISPSVTDAWTKATRSLCQVYAQAMKVAGTRSAHIHAWEAAWVCLYTQELERAASDPSRAPRHPREFALRMARMKVGQPQPRADKRFLVEAFWATLNVRFILADLGFVWLKAANKNGSNYDLQQRRAWAKYGIFVLDSCEKDAQTAFMIAKESGSRRQMTTTSLLIMRGNLELFRFRVGVAQESGVMKNTEERAKLAAEASSGASDAKEFISLTIREHLAVLPADRQDWIGSRFWDTARAIEDEWKNLEKSIRAETFYEPVSLDEKTAIVKAFEFTHTGHFYNCPNGHTFVITECGGANQVSRCPECGERIGGSSHQLDAQNTRAMEFEDIARQMGTQASPWRWGV